MEYIYGDGSFSAIIEVKTRDISEELIDRLVQCRKEKGLTQQDISNITGMQRANIARLENCNNTPSLDVLLRYATALGMRLTFELEEIEDQRDGRNKATAINTTYIDSGEYRRKFDAITADSELNKLLYSCAKEMLYHRSGTEYEDMYWFDAQNKSSLCSKLDELIPGEIRHTKRIDNLIKRCPYVIAMHTHPHSMPPSPEDFNTYLKSGYSMGIVLCHNGTIYIYHAYEHIDVHLWAAYVAEYAKKNYKSDQAQLETLKKFQKNRIIDLKEIKL